MERARPRPRARFSGIPFAFLIQQAIESISRRESSAPKTILGFLLGMYGVLIAASAAVILGLVASDSSELVVYVLGFGALVTVALGAAVIVIAWKDPSRLMLGQVSAREYANIRRLHLGDDKQGDQPTRVIGSTLVDERPARDMSATAQIATPEDAALGPGEEVEPPDPATEKG